MKRMHLNSALATVLLATLALAGCKKDEPTPPPTVVVPAAPAPTPAPVAAVSVVSVDLANAVAADTKLMTPAGSFAPKDPIIAVVSTSTSDPAATVTGKLGAKWTFQDGQMINEESKDVVFTGAGTTQFQISKPDGWPVGAYKVEISLDGTVVQSKDFSVQ